MTPAKDRPASTLIICSRNRPRLLLETVRSVLDGDVVPDEMIVVDQSDECHPALTSLIDQHCDVRYLWSHQSGLSRARNLGISVARHPLVLFADDDVLVERTWYRTLLTSLLAKGPRTIVTGQVRPASEDNGFAPSTITDTGMMEYRGRVQQDVLYTASMGAYQSSLLEVGGFDNRIGPGTSFPSAEDNDLGFRLLEAGYSILYIPEAVIYHRNWRTRRDLLPLRWSYGMGRGAFYAKHVTKHDSFMLRRLVRDVSGHIARSRRFLLRDRMTALGDVVLALGIMAGAIRWSLTQRRRD